MHKTYIFWLCKRVYLLITHKVFSDLVYWLGYLITQGYIISVLIPPGGGGNMEMQALGIKYDERASPSNTFFWGALPLRIKKNDEKMILRRGAGKNILPKKIEIPVRPHLLTMINQTQSVYCTYIYVCIFNLFSGISHHDKVSNKNVYDLCIS